MSATTEAMPNATTEDDLAGRVEELETQLAALRDAPRGTVLQNSIALVCFSGDWDKLFAAFTIANGALAMEQEVHMFFTFWGATAIRGGGSCSPGGEKDWTQRLLGAFLPKDANATPMSRMNYLGVSKKMFSRLLRKKGIDDLPTLMERATDLGAKFYCCDTSLRLYGWCNDDLREGDASVWCGVSTFLNEAAKSKVTLFI